MVRKGDVEMRRVVVVVVVRVRRYRPECGITGRVGGMVALR